MKDSNLLYNDQNYIEYLSEESTTQFIVKPFHIIGTAVLLVAWAWLGTIIIG